jgi:hypothetical protein
VGAHVQVIRYFLALAVITTFSAPRTAAAEATEQQCIAAAVSGQKLRRGGELRSAQERFSLCAQATCPRDVAADGVRWFAEAADSLSSIVVVARDAEGRDLADVHVTVDGEVVDAAAVRAIPLDPGQHVIVFSRPGDAEVTRTVVLREGEKHREVVGTFAAPIHAESAVGSSTPVPASSARRWPAYLSGGIGIAGLGTFAVAASIGFADRESSHCGSGCPPVDFSRVQTELRVADVALAVGVLSSALATWLILSARSADARRTSSAR